MDAPKSVPTPKPKSWPLPSDLLPPEPPADPPASKAPAAKAQGVPEEAGASPPAKSKSSAVCGAELKTLVFCGQI